MATDDLARGGAFSGTTTGTQVPGAPPTAPIAEDLSRGGLFRDAPSTGPAPTAPTAEAVTEDGSQGSLFAGQNILPIQTIPEDQMRAIADDHSRGGLFDSNLSGINTLEGPRGPAGADGMNGAAGRGITNVSSTIVGSDVQLTFSFTDDTTQTVSYTTSEFQLPTLLQDFSDDLDSQAISVTTNLGIRKSAGDNVDLVPVTGGGGPPSTVTTFRLVVSFDDDTTTSATLNGTPTTVNTTMSNIAIAGGMIGTNAEVEVNGVNFLRDTDYRIVSGVLVFDAYQLELGDGDLIIITWTMEN